jgi:hypothetical protein
MCGVGSWRDICSIYIQRLDGVDCSGIVAISLVFNQIVIWMQIARHKQACRLIFLFTASTMTCSRKKIVSSMSGFDPFSNLPLVHSSMLGLGQLNCHMKSC